MPFFKARLRDLKAFKRNPKGEIGIEIECEGMNLPSQYDNIADFWEVHADGSLRGESAEYVLRQPIRRDQVEASLDNLKAAFQLRGTRLAFSNRTSVHVHLNMQNKTMQEIFTLLCLYFIYEDALTELAGATRKGNLFCLRLSDAEAILDALIECAEEQHLKPLGADGLRYSACNVNGLTKYGTLEFRALRGTDDKSIITTWINLLTSIVDAAVKYNTPGELIQEFSALGPVAFTQKVFGEVVPFEYTTAQLFHSLRLVQQLAYASDWNDRPEPAKTVFMDGFAEVAPVGVGFAVHNDGPPLRVDWAQFRPAPRPPRHQPDPLLMARALIRDENRVDDGEPVELDRMDVQFMRGDA